MSEVWVRDVEGYDARGGQAEVFSSERKAMDSVPGVRWERTYRGELMEEGQGSSDVYVIYRRVMDAAALDGGVS